MEQFYLSSLLSNPHCPASDQWPGSNEWATVYGASETVENMRHQTVLIGEVDINNSALSPVGACMMLNDN